MQVRYPAGRQASGIMDVGFRREVRATVKGMCQPRAAAEVRDVSSSGVLLNKYGGFVLLPREGRQQRQFALEMSP